jgi:hypothetical protein
VSRQVEITKVMAKSLIGDRATDAALGLT